MIDVRPLFRPSFWFGAHPTPIMAFSSRFLLAFFTIMLIGGAVVRLVARKRYNDRYVLEAFHKMATMLSTMGFLGLIWLFFAVEQITFIQGRYWMLVWLIGLIVWSVSIWRYYYRTVPKERERRNAYHERNKYLHTKKR